MVKLTLVNIDKAIKIRDRLKSDLAAVERYLEIARRIDLEEQADRNRGHEVDAERQTVLTSVSQQTASYGAVGRAVLDAITFAPTEFKLSDLNGILKGNPLVVTKLQIGTALARLVRQGKIVQVQAKQGKRGALYRLNQISGAGAGEPNTVNRVP